MQNMAYQPIKMSDLSNESNLGFVTDVMKSFRVHNLKVTYGCMEIEEVGHTLVQEAWRDSTGVYVKYRLLPSDADRLGARDAANAFGKDFVELVCNRFKVKGKECTILNTGTDRDFLAWVSTGSHSIGDLCYGPVTDQKSSAK